MTANIDPINSAAPPGAAAPAKQGATATGQFSEALAKAQGPRSADAVIPPSPPPELADHIAAAARAWEALSASGRHVAFDGDGSGRVRIELHDGDGRSETLSGSGLMDMIDELGEGA